MRFVARPLPCPELLSAIELMPPYSPFNTAAYAAARAALGDQPHVVGIERDGALAAGCIALVTRSRFTGRLDIPSLPRIDATDTFARGLRAFCRRHRLWDVTLGSFGSTEVTMMSVGRETERRQRWEFVIDLDHFESSFKPGSRQRRNIRKAEKAGISVSRFVSRKAVDRHVELMQESMRRRATRGEAVDTRIPTAPLVAMVDAGAAELHQAFRDDEVVSSILIVRSARVGYYHSAGTSPSGMKVGASPFLIKNVAAALAANGATEFNLGGAEPDNQGLWDFKRAFGTAERPLEAASYSMVPAVVARLRGLLRRIVGSH